MADVNCTAVQAFLLGNLLRRGLVSRTPIAYLYNGVQLPGLPEWDKTVYPYAVIVYNTASEAYFLHVCANPATITTFISTITLPGPRQYYQLTSGAWELVDTLTGDGAFGKSAYTWSNHDILDDANGAVVLSGSEPVPVCE